MTGHECEGCEGDQGVARVALEIVQAVLTLEHYDPKWLALDERTRKAALIRLIREAVNRTPYEPHKLVATSHFAAWPSHYTTGYVVWIYRQGQWEIKESHCADCHDPGPPPEFAGEYENQCVAQACVRRTAM